MALQAAAEPQLRDERPALEELGGVHRSRRARARFRVHRLRQRRRRNLPGLAGPADDRALGRRGPGRVRRQRREDLQIFRKVYGYLDNRIKIFVSLPVASLDRMSLQKRLEEIGRELPARRRDECRLMTSITIYHNPACGTSRNVLGLIRNSGVEPTIIEYLKTPAAARRAGRPDRPDGHLRARSAAPQGHAL